MARVSSFTGTTSGIGVWLLASVDMINRITRRPIAPWTDSEMRSLVDAPARGDCARAAAFTKISVRCWTVPPRGSAWPASGAGSGRTDDASGPAVAGHAGPHGLRRPRARQRDGGYFVIGRR